MSLSTVFSELFASGFPATTVVWAIREGLPLSADEWPKDKVIDLYKLYKEAVDAGNDIISPGNYESGYYMEKNSNYAENDIRVFLSTLYNLSKDGKIDQKFWNIERQSKSGIIQETTGITRTIESTGKAVKWTSILLITGAALYVLYPFIRRR